uniref:Uncharacterized protein n=1 Tax=Arundo donax TaxID=35708 RepID=A0A0A9C7H8_ARUDO
MYWHLLKLHAFKVLVWSCRNRWFWPS